MEEGLINYNNKKHRKYKQHSIVIYKSRSLIRQGYLSFLRQITVGAYMKNLS